MKVETLFSLMASGRSSILRSVSGKIENYYRICFLVAAGRCGLLTKLKATPARLEEIGDAMGIANQSLGTLRDWLQIGIDLGEVRESNGRWSLSGSTAKALSDRRNDDLLALLEEVVDLHHRLLLETPRFLREGRKFTLADQVGSVIARSSRVLEPFVREAIATYVPRSGLIQVLEIGCGSGTYMHYCMELNRELQVVGCELQPEVAAMARDNLSRWGVDSRSRVDVGDFRTLGVKGEFDLITMHNNIYYFEVAERVDLFKKIKCQLKQGGRFLLTTGCRGGSCAMSTLNLWSIMTENCGALPTPDELMSQLHQAGFKNVASHNLTWPVESFYCFTGIADA